jgi:hypothetical protein
MNSILYAGNALGPAKISGNTNDVLESGFTTIQLGLLHIGRGPGGAKNPKPGLITGDIVFNNEEEGGLIVISNGVYKGPETWPSQLKQLLSSQGKVTRMGWSVGGGECEDYQTIWGNFLVDPKNNALYENFAELKKIFPFVDFIDLDCEEFESGYYPDYKWIEAVTDFGIMLKAIGFSLTLCPYKKELMSGWMEILTRLYALRGPSVSWINLQCYDGGDDNDPQTWAKEVQNLGIDVPFIVPGLWCCNNTEARCGSTPSEVKDKFAGWKAAWGKEIPPPRGGFIWNYEDILANENSPACAGNVPGSANVEKYRAAIVEGLTPDRGPGRCC